jgi:hypothetical protein
MRILRLDLLQGDTDARGVLVGGKKLVFDVWRPRKVALRDRIDVGRDPGGGQTVPVVGVDRHFSVVLAVAVRAHRRIDDVPGGDVSAGARGSAVVEHVPALALGLINRHRALRHGVVHVGCTGLRQLVADAARVLSLRRNGSTHARCQSSAPDIQFPWRSWPALFWNSSAWLAILLRSSSGSIV